MSDHCINQDAGAAQNGVPTIFVQDDRIRIPEWALNALANYSEASASTENQSQYSGYEAARTASSVGPPSPLRYGDYAYADQLAVLGSPARSEPSDDSRTSGSSYLASPYPASPYLAPTSPYTTGSSRQSTVSIGAEVVDLTTVDDKEIDGYNAWTGTSPYNSSDMGATTQAGPLDDKCSIWSACIDDEVQRDIHTWFSSSANVKLFEKAFAERKYQRNKYILLGKRLGVPWNEPQLRTYICSNHTKFGLTEKGQPSRTIANQEKFEKLMSEGQSRKTICEDFASQEYPIKLRSVKRLWEESPLAFKKQHYKRWLSRNTHAYVELAKLTGDMYSADTGDTDIVAD